MLPFRAVLTALFVAWPWPAIDPHAGETRRPEFAESAALLGAGKHAEALAKAELGLEYAPDDGALLELASRAAEAGGDLDKALWYGTLALDELVVDKTQAELAKKTELRLATLDPHWATARAALTELSRTWLDQAKLAAGKKNFVNAVELYTRAKSGPLASQAESSLGKLYDDKKAVAAILESGLDVPVRSKSKKTPAQRAREDAKHDTWDKPWEVKGEQYTVRTDMSFETAEAMSRAMEQMNRFYRQVFKVKELGGQTARVTLVVYKSRNEFDQHEKRGDGPVPAGVKGYFSPGELKVVTYDHRTEGIAGAFLWSTLFHEASHQFTDMISADLVPAWLNEGTASYFEGARLLSNGTVETNLVPDSRLRGLVASFAEGKPTLKEVVSFYEPGSYPGEYYPFGWGLVYFLRNYEDEQSRRVYESAYQDYMASYRTGGKHDPFQRWVDFFVTRAKQPEVATFEDFEARWKKWILELEELHFGGAQKAELLISRARKQHGDGQSAAAIASYRAALRKRPDDAQAHFELGQLFAAAKAKDAALYHLRRARGLACEEVPDGAGPADESWGEFEADCTQRITDLDPEWNKALLAAETKFAAQAAAAITAFTTAQRPRVALELVRRSHALLGGTSTIEALAEAVRADHDVSLALWQRLAWGDDLAEWEAGPEWSGEPVALLGRGPRGEGIQQCLLREELAGEFSFEARVEASDLADDSAFGLIFGASPNATYLCAVLDNRGVVIAKLEDRIENLAQFGPIAKDKLASFVLGLELGRGRVKVLIDDQPLGEYDLPPEDLAGRVGLFVQSARARFSELRILR